MFENLENVVGYKTVVGVHVFTYVLENLANVEYCRYCLTKILFRS